MRCLRHDAREANIHGLLGGYVSEMTCLAACEMGVINLAIMDIRSMIARINGRRFVGFQTRR